MGRNHNPGLYDGAQSLQVPSFPGGPISGGTYSTGQGRGGQAFLSQLPCTPLSRSLVVMKKQRWAQLSLPHQLHLGYQT